MRVLVTGATGFVGRPLCLRLRRDGHEVVALSRSPASAQARLDPDVTVVPLRPEDGGGFDKALEGVDAVVHLAGESIAGGRWTPSRKARIRASRVDLTRVLVDTIRKRSERPSVLVSGSAVGVYGDRGDELLTEESGPGEGFLSEVATAWEREAREAEALGLRVACVRTGVVLGRDGGALPVMSLPFRFGLGGPVAGGGHWMPWIHLDDIVEIFARAVTDDQLHGPVLGTAPASVTNAAFTSALGRALGVPAILPAPAFALRLVLGEAAALALDSVRCSPARLLALGHTWRHPDLDTALRDLVDTSPVHAISTHRGLRVRAETAVRAEPGAVADWLARPGSLGALAPGDLRLSAVDDEGAATGSDPWGAWRAEVSRPEPLQVVYRRTAGSFRAWTHAQRALAAQDGCTVYDTLDCTPPAFGFGARRRLAHLFDHRRRALQWRFGSVEETR